MGLGAERGRRKEVGGGAIRPGGGARGHWGGIVGGIELVFNTKSVRNLHLLQSLASRGYPFLPLPTSARAPGTRSISPRLEGLLSSPPSHRFHTSAQQFFTPSNGDSAAGKGSLPTPCRSGAPRIVLLTHASNFARAPKNRFR